MHQHLSCNKHFNGSSQCISYVIDLALKSAVRQLKYRRKLGTFLTSYHQLSFKCIRFSTNINLLNIWWRNNFCWKMLYYTTGLTKILYPELHVAISERAFLCFWFGLFFEGNNFLDCIIILFPEDRGSNDIYNVSNYLPDRTVLQPRRHPSSNKRRILINTLKPYFV